MNKKLSYEQKNNLLKTLKSRFENNLNRHLEIDWDNVHKKLENNHEKLWSLYEMERTGGEPDVVGYDKKSDMYVFYDCSEQSPQGRRNLCYDRAALEARKVAKPANNVIDLASNMGIQLLNEEEYKELQKLGEFDTKTQSWIETPVAIRELGGAIFADRRFNHVFIYHNGAESYYAGRGFRGSLRV